MATPTHENPLLILAMDHRDSFGKQFGVSADSPTDEQAAQMRDAKHLIYQGLHDARSQLTQGQAGVLVDEEFGAQVLRDAKNEGLVVAMPVEKSGRELFELQYGDDTEAHIDEFAPDYVKVLVRMNPYDNPGDIAAQLTELAKLSAMLAARHQPLLYELLVPATPLQSNDAGSKAAYDKDIRPGLVVEVIAANQRAGVEPALWKIEGLETTDAARDVVAAAKADGRTADCIVLGRDAPKDVLDHWISIAAPVPGFVGFAVGRSIWEDALTEHRKDGDDDRLVATVRDNYLHYAQAYLAAR